MLVQKRSSIVHKGMASFSPHPTIHGLPDAALAHIAEFLSYTHRALLAVGLTASSSTWRKSNWKIRPSEASKVICSKREWNGEVIIYANKDLAAKLTDNDIGGVLACVQSVHEIKVVKLTNCVNISGCGLEPLRNSIHLEQLDLGLVGLNESPNISPEPMISEAAVIPILHSIVETDGCSLSHLQFPKKWRLGQSRTLDHFLARYNSMMNSRNLVCSAEEMENGEFVPCGNRFRGEQHNRPWVNREGDHFGINNYSCYRCRKHSCPDCSNHENENLWSAGTQFISDLVCEKCEQKCCTKCTYGNETLMCEICEVSKSLSGGENDFRSNTDL